VTNPFWALIAVFTILQIKHFICDYPLQSTYQLANKGTYGHPGGIIHSGLQALFTLPIFLLVTPTFALGVGIIVGEFVLHYNLDWTKSQINKRFALAGHHREFWWAIGADQLAHHLTYIAIAGLLVGLTIGTG